ELIGPRGTGGRRRLTPATAKRLRNCGGGLAGVTRNTHSLDFYVLVPQCRTWTEKGLKGPRIVSVKLMVPRGKLRSTAYPRALERRRDLPGGTVSTRESIALHYGV